MTDTELRDAAVAELHLTTRGLKGFSPPPKSHWGKALKLLDQIGQAPPPPSGLKWPAPQGSFTELVITNDNRHFNLDPSKDYVLRGSGVIDRKNENGLVVVTGGRNVIIRDLVTSINTQWSGGSNYWQRALITQDQTGTLHIENWRDVGLFTGQSLTLVQNKGAVVQLQNSLLKTLHPSLDVIHPDCIQSWAGPKTLRMWNVTMHTSYYAIQVTPRQYGYSGAIEGWDFERVNIRQFKPVGGLLAKTVDGAWWGERHADVWVDGPDPWYFVNWTRNEPGWNPGGGTNVTGEAIKKGIPPGGDFVT